jgi:hypothetical protein
MMAIAHVGDRLFARQVRGDGITPLKTVTSRS